MMLPVTLMLTLIKVASHSKRHPLVQVGMYCFEIVERSYQDDNYIRIDDSDQYRFRLVSLNGMVKMDDHPRYYIQAWICPSPWRSQKRYGLYIIVGMILNIANLIYFLYINKTMRVRCYHSKSLMSSRPSSSLASCTQGPRTSEM